MERIEKLDYDLQIYQNSELYTFTSDAVLLAKFAKIKKGQIVADFGTGSGIIALYMAKAGAGKVYAVEIQSEMAEMARKSVQLNNLENIIEVVNENIKNFNVQVDVVVSNPPYKKVCEYVNMSKSRAIARHEVEIDMDSLIDSVKKVLKFGGAFYVCYDADRTAELISKLSKNSLEPKEMFFTQSAVDKPASIVFVKAVKGGKSGIKILPTLITNSADGKYIENLKVN